MNPIELVDAVEAAKHGDSVLSANVALAVHDWLHEVDGNKPLNCRLRNQQDSPVYLGGDSHHMNYSVSLDAAMQLIPEGWRIYTADFSIAGRFSWMLQGPKAPWTDPEDGHEYIAPSYARGTATTPALSLTAAALRARQTSTQDPAS